MYDEFNTIEEVSDDEFFLMEDNVVDLTIEDDSSVESLDNPVPSDTYFVVEFNDSLNGLVNEDVDAEDNDDVSSTTTESTTPSSLPSLSS